MREINSPLDKDFSHLIDERPSIPRVQSCILTLFDWHRKRMALSACFGRKKFADAESDPYAKSKPQSSHCIRGPDNLKGGSVLSHSCTVWALAVVTEVWSHDSSHQLAPLASRICPSSVRFGRNPQLQDSKSPLVLESFISPSTNVHTFLSPPRGNKIVQEHSSEYGNLTQGKLAVAIQNVVRKKNNEFSVLYCHRSYGCTDDTTPHLSQRCTILLLMTSLAETALSIVNPPPIARPRKLLKSLPDIVRRILPHARYSSFLETLVAGSHPDTPTCKTPSLPVQDEVPCKDSIARDNTRYLRTSLGAAELHTLPSCPDDLVFRVIYKARGKFAWMNGRKIEDVKVLKWLGGECLVDETSSSLNGPPQEGAMSSAHIKSGRVETSQKDRRESVAFNYVCKT